MAIDEITKSINNTLKPLDEHLEYPTCSGIYVFALKEKSKLKQFGISGHMLYVGIAKNSLNGRDLGNHFKNESTGNSTLRCSIGAILKEEFSLRFF